MIIKNTIKKILREFLLRESNLQGKTYKVYHGTNEKFTNFDFSKTAQGVMWFTDSKESIIKASHGGNGNKYIITNFITLKNPAGWDEYENYSIDELINMGFDGVILPEDDKTDFIVFNPETITKK